MNRDSLQRLALFLGFLIAAVCVSGCSTETNAVVQSLQYVFNRGVSADVPLNPNFRYLRMTVDGRVILLALGYIDADPGGDVEVWYSADREVIRLQNGRVVGAVGFSPEWRNVTMRGAPAWARMANTYESVEWERVRDIMPGYRSGIVDRIVTRRIAPASRSALVGLEPDELLWFEDVRIAELSGFAGIIFPVARDDDLALPAAHVGLVAGGNGPTAIYGEQCLSRKFCLTWQNWPPSKRDEQSSQSRTFP